MAIFSKGQARSKRKLYQILVEYPDGTTHRGVYGDSFIQLDLIRNRVASKYKNRRYYVVEALDRKGGKNEICGS